MKTKMNLVLGLVLLSSSIAYCEPIVTAVPGPPSAPVVVQTTPAPDAPDAPRPPGAPSTALPGTAFMPRAAAMDYQYLIASTRASGTGGISVINFQQHDQSEVDEMGEDLKTMSLLITENLDRVFANDTPAYKLGVPLFLHTQERSGEATYVEGFGAIFKLKVQFPLVAPASEQVNAPKRKTTTEWERARRAVTGAPTEEQESFVPLEQGQPYQATLVETLKNQLLDTLTNASNFRHVPDGEFVVVNVVGTPNFDVTRVAALPPGRNTTNPAGTPEPGEESEANTPEAEQKRAYGADRTGNPGRKFSRIVIRRDAERPTLMTVRIKKADADALAAGKMSREDFQKAAQVTTYYGQLLSGGDVAPMGWSTR